MPAWLIWLITAVVLMVAEMFSLDLVLLMFSLGALAAAGAAGLGASLMVQSLTFAVVSILALVVIRPLARPLLNKNHDKARTGIEALRGISGITLQRVDEFSGRVKIAGEEWTARTVDPSETIEVGETVVVAEIQGATALVRRRTS